MGNHISVAIDGPSGAGKSSIAKRAAAHFGFIYVDTGAIYRTVGLAVQRAGFDSRDEASTVKLLPKLKIDMDYDGAGQQRMLLYGEDVSEEIRTPKSSIYASDVSAMPSVRAFLMDMQRGMAERHDVIMDGRDIGTAVLPDAGLKIFLTASAEARAQRRLAELRAKGVETDFSQVLRDMEYRDSQDSEREASPLRRADDAVELDTTLLSFEQSFEAVCKLIKERFVL